mgnify:CR=1 FL=1
MTFLNIVKKAEENFGGDYKRLHELSPEAHFINDGLDACDIAQVILISLQPYFVPVFFTKKSFLHQFLQKNRVIHIQFLLKNGRGNKLAKYM